MRFVTTNEVFSFVELTCGTKFLRIGDFWVFAGTIFCNMVKKWIFLLD